MDSDHLTVHGTTVDLDGTAILLRGPSGSGKSDLALRLMEGGAVLVSDDQTCLRVNGTTLTASAPPVIAGMIEVRGIGLLRVPHHDDVTLGLVVDMTDPLRVERLPDDRSVTYLDIAVPLLELDPFAASTAAKIRYYLRGRA